MKRDLPLKGTVKDTEGNWELADQAFGPRTSPSVQGGAGDGSNDGHSSAENMISRLGPAGRETGGASAPAVMRRTALRQCLLWRRPQQRSEEPSEGPVAISCGGRPGVRIATLATAA